MDITNYNTAASFLAGCITTGVVTSSAAFMSDDMRAFGFTCIASSGSIFVASVNLAVRSIQEADPGALVGDIFECLGGFVASGAFAIVGALALKGKFDINMPNENKDEEVELEEVVLEERGVDRGGESEYEDAPDAPSTPLQQRRVSN